jgi:hypothetical protein
MKDYYKVLSHFYSKEKLEPIKNDQIKLIKLYNITRDAFPKNDPRWSNADPEQGRANYYGPMTIKKLKEYIKEVITNTLNEGELEENILAKVTGKSGKSTTISAKNSTELSNMKRQNTNVQDIEPLEELEPNSKQKLKLANRELAFLAKQVKSLEKQIKSQGSNEDKG